jgi:hypothetical protein
MIIVIDTEKAGDDWEQLYRRIGGAIAWSYFDRPYEAPILAIDGNPIGTLTVEEWKEGR